MQQLINITPLNRENIPKLVTFDIAGRKAWQTMNEFLDISKEEKKY